ncbi:hypothetical protein M408DRAFT_331142 [Serendipita vermifera MAFF 305830]|uniref:Glutamyl-tRNA(Gln) amidotransferase subunit F, mitochondrial n=1 Tax=Serendipita vermifera MAFF 305830 TaxID=933852 RepID=A0A0C3B085_SERVB|nr:hypothetical protein M408DRAFT_331142 [Serendipita vermifera MAFF 305830]
MNRFSHAISQRIKSSSNGIAARIVLAKPQQSSGSRHVHNTHQSRKEHKAVEVDEFGIPTQPTWSVKSFLASYPSPAIDDETLDKLHRLSALKAPEKGSEEREVLRGEMEQLVRLVGAVRVADIPTDEGDGFMDGRIYPLSQKIDFAHKPKPKDAGELVDSGEKLPSGRELLRHSQTANETVYVLPDLSKR